jgi:hypothetical protein
MYLDLYFYLAGFNNYIASAPSRPVSTSDPSLAIVDVRCAGAPSELEEQFPTLVAEHRHVLLNRKRSLYAVQLNPRRRLLSVELLDRSPHVQMVLYHVALSDHLETALDYRPSPKRNDARHLGGAVVRAGCETVGTRTGTRFLVEDLTPDQHGAVLKRVTASYLGQAAAY